VADAGVEPKATQAPGPVAPPLFGHHRGRAPGPVRGPTRRRWRPRWRRRGWGYRWSIPLRPTTIPTPEGGLGARRSVSSAIGPGRGPAGPWPAPGSPSR